MGTDQFCIAAPSRGDRPLTSASPHMKFGEIVALAVRDATAEALRWQNGLEASYTRGIFTRSGDTESRSRRSSTARHQDAGQ